MLKIVGLNQKNIDKYLRNLEIHKYIDMEIINRFTRDQVEKMITSIDMEQTSAAALRKYFWHIYKTTGKETLSSAIVNI